MMSVLVTSDFNDDSIKNEQAWNIFGRRSRAANSVDRGRNRPKFELIQATREVIRTAGMKKIGPETTKKK